VNGRVFTVEERDRVRDRVLELASADARVVVGAVVGALRADGRSLVQRRPDSTIYRVLLLPRCLQVDLSFTPASAFGGAWPAVRAALR
jgi:hypothetical protein